MMKALLPVLTLLHAIAHLPGFLKAFRLAAIQQLQHTVSRFEGALWLLVALLFIAGAGLALRRVDSWWMVLIPAVILSQGLIFSMWQDAKYGTIANAIIILAIIQGAAAWNFRHTYTSDASSGLKAAAALPASLLQESDLDHLPAAVQKYILLTGAVGKPKVRSFRVAFEGRIRKNEQSPWMPFSSVQYNFIDRPTRLFYLNATMKGLPVAGYHRYQDGSAYMDIRLLSLYRVQYSAGPEMDTAETVTFFNDMCCMAPATLIDKRIVWLEDAGNKVRAAFRAHHITITAWLYFNDEGQLVDFVSDDRYAAGDNKTMSRIRWSTPLKDFRRIGDQRLSTYADAIYHYPAGPLCYGQFRVTDIEYNGTEIR